MPAVGDSLRNSSEIRAVLSDDEDADTVTDKDEGGGRDERTSALSSNTTFACAFPSDAWKNALQLWSFDMVGRNLYPFRW